MILYDFPKKVKLFFSYDYLTEKDWGKKQFIPQKNKENWNLENKNEEMKEGGSVH
jgi:hypothetical protein